MSRPTTGAPIASHRSTLAWLFVAFVWLLSLHIGHTFFETMRGQLLLSNAERGLSDASAGWSAPLDDVFIHFDFARAIARGYPFQWSEGNGYSSGGTSLLYPFVLALGYRIGYQGTSLMLWAGIVATLSVVGVLLLTRFMTRRLSPWTAFVIPPLFLSVGGLNWSLWSGMEVAFFLLVWAACFNYWDTCLRAPVATYIQNAAKLGLLCAILVATRPESAPIVACFGLTLLSAKWRSTGFCTRAAALCLCGVPAIVVLTAQALANHAYTGEWSAAGGLVKLELNHPYLTSKEIWDAWLFHLRYQIVRITNHHLSTHVLRVGSVELTAGWLIWAFALLPLLRQATRQYAILLWFCIITWTLTVALNGHVRWQNERYAMPEVAWLMLAAGLGLACILNDVLRAFQSPGARTRGWLLAIPTVAAAGCYALLSRDQYHNQLWFFGRAARNIADQQVEAGRQVRALKGHRILVGDAGAIPYISDLPALDLIGLGGYHDLPFARASRLGLGAGIELLQRLPDADRPDLMAIYPSWWGQLPLWFGERLAAIPAPGNVICGGREKVIYRADFSPLIGTDNPTGPKRDERVRGELDFADLVSESAGHTRFEGTPGYITMKLLAHPKNSKADLWDAGRILPPGASVVFDLSSLVAHEPAKLLLRVAPAQTSEIELFIDGASITKQVLSPLSAWQEIPLAIPREYVGGTNQIQIRAVAGETILYHAWVLQER